MTEAPKPSARQIAARVIKDRVLAWDDTPSIGELNEVLRVAAMWRSSVIAATYQHHQGVTVLQGPFAGMTYVAAATEGALSPRLLGVYESELHPHIEAFADEGLDCVIDVGCAEGYYAVGLARRMPGVTVHAHDISATARAACADLARKNGVADRVIVGGEFQPEDFQRFAGRKALVIVDAEGAEVDILDPARGPALAGFNVIVETHDLFRPGALQTLVDRFSPTHDIVRVDQDLKIYERPAWLQDLTHLDQLLAVWEWRTRPTPWLVMRPKTN